MKKHLLRATSFLPVTLMMAALVICSSCEEKESFQSAACDITGFTVNGTAWDISGTDITYVYPPETDESQPLAPTITVSTGATVTPASGTAQNFFTGAGVTYTVTAEDGVTKKTYVAKATRTPHATCDITGFTVNGTAWDISGTDITYVYPPETDESQPLAPTITVSTGATVTPASGVAQNFFTGTGVSYTVTAEDGVTKKTYVAKATFEFLLSGITGSCTWTLTGAYQSGTGTLTLTISGAGAMANYDASNLPPWHSYRPAIQTLVIQDGVTAIGNQAFYECIGFTSALTIPNSVTTIGIGAFLGCRGFTSALTIGNSVTTIDTAAFYGCSGFTGALTIPNSVTYIGNYAFSGCRGFTGALTIGNSVTTIGNEAFSGCRGFTDALTIGNSVTTIGFAAFASCEGLTGALTIPNSVTTIGDLAFSGCSGFTGALTIGNSVITIGNQAFYNCSGFTGALTIGNSVTAIGNYAFRYCSGFTGALTIGHSVTDIGNFAFAYCDGLTQVTSLRTTPPSAVGAFEGFDVSSRTLRVPASSVAAYQSQSPWSGFGTIIGM